jgi:hypothetical protein
MTQRLKKAQVVITAGHQHYHLMCAVEDHGEQTVAEALARDIVQRSQVPLWLAHTRAGIELEAMLALQKGEGRYKVIRQTLDAAAHATTAAPAQELLTELCPA